MAFRRKWTPTLFKICLALIGTAGALWIGIGLVLPACLVSGAFYRTLDALGLPDLDWDVRRVGLFGADIAAVRIGAPEGPGLVMDAVRLDYSPVGMRLGRIAITGLEVTCGIENGRFFIEGLDLESLKKQFQPETSPSGARTRPKAAPELPAFMPETIEIRHSLIRFAWEERVFRIPVDLRVVFPREGLLLLQVWTNAVLHDQSIACSGEVDRESGRSRWRISAPGVLIAPLLRAAGLVPEPAVSGTVDIRADVAMALGDAGRDGRGEASLAFIPHETAPAGHITGTAETRFSVDFTFGLADLGAWRFALSSLNPADAAPASPLRLGRVSLHGSPPRITLSGEGTADAGAVRCRLNAGPVRAEAPGVDLRVKAVSLDGDIRFEGAEKVRGTLKLAWEEATLTVGPAKDRATVRLPSLALSGDAVLSREGGLRFDGKGELAGATVTVPGSRTTVEDIRLSLPLTWPWGTSKAAGSLAFSAFRWDRQDMGALKGRLHPRAEGLRFDGDFAARLLPGLVLKLTGDAPFLVPQRPSALSWSTRYRPASPLDLGRFAKAAKGMTFDGTLTVAGRMEAGGDTAAVGSMTASLAGGRITAKERDMRMDDIRLNLQFPTLPALRSAPDQGLAVGKATLGKIRIEDAGFRFQIEPDTTVLIEKGGFTWCGGTVSTQSLRIAPGMADVDLILYCDRLNLARLLDQLGAAKAEGRGAVNGRLPIRLRNGTVRFDDGFLYSTPGEGGVIHVTEARVLTVGIPENTPQFAQIDLAVEALKSYEYAWAKLGITTEGENLRLNLQFDGKPTAPLPFVYQKEFGGFVRVTADHPGSVFQGIRLDVNLGLPLDKILRYRGLMDKIQ